jgi:hypothetical protein
METAHKIVKTQTDLINRSPWLGAGYNRRYAL